MKEFIFLFCFFVNFVCGVIDDSQPPTTRPVQVEELPWLKFFDRKSSLDDFGKRGSARNNLDLTSYSTLCPPGETGQFPYPPDCKRFINCWKGRGAIQVCAPGTLFNPETFECDFPGKVKCQDGDQMPMPSKARYVRFPNQRPEIAENPVIERKNQEQSKPDSIPARPYPGRPPYFGPSHLKPPTRPGNQTRGGVPPRCALGATGLYPHPYDCTKFLKCWSGNTFVQSCGPGTFFNPLISACDHPHNVPCAHEEVYQPDEFTGITAEEEQIPEESVQYEQYQDVNQGIQIKGKKTIKQDPESPNYEEVPQVVPGPTPKSEVDNLNPSTPQTESTHRKPKVINKGGSHQQNQFTKTHGKEPAPYLTPPKYDVYGNLISSEVNQLGVQPSQSNQPNHENSPEVPNHNHRLPSHNDFLNYPAQGPYSSSQSLDQHTTHSTKNYYGYLLNKKLPHQKHPLNPTHTPHPYHPHHPPHPKHPHHPQGGPPMWLVPPPFQQNYAPNHPFFHKIETPTSYVIPQAPYYPHVMQIPYYPIVTGSNPCFSTSGSNQNEPSAPKCEPGMAFYQPGSDNGGSKPSGLPQGQNSKPQNIPAGYHPIYSQDSSSIANSFVPIYTQKPVGQHPYQYQFGNQYPNNQVQSKPEHPSSTPQTPVSNGQTGYKPKQTGDPNLSLIYSGSSHGSKTNYHNYHESTSSQSSGSSPTPSSLNLNVNQPASGYNPQHQQTGKPDLSLIYSSGSTYVTQSHTSGHTPTSSPSQIPSGGNQPGSSYNPQTYPQANWVPWYQPGTYYRPPISNQNIDSQDISQHETHPENPSTDKTPQYRPYPFNYYPIDPNVYLEFLPSYYPSQNYPQTPSNSPTTPQAPREQGQVPIPDPFSTTDKNIRPSAPNYENGNRETPEGQVQVPDPFLSKKNYISKDNDYQPSNLYPVYRPPQVYPNKVNENVQGCSDHCSKDETKEEPSQPTATFPPFPGYTERPKNGNIKTATKSKPKDYILDKIDLRVKEEEEDLEDVESVPPTTTTQAPRRKGSEKVDEEFIKENPRKPTYTLPDKYSQQEESNKVQPEDEENKKSIKPESDFDGLPQEEEKPKKADRKPFIKVRHPPANAQTVRLRNGATHLDGYLEMRDEKSKWGLVCDKAGGWSIAEATVACRGLGFVRGAELSWQGYPIKSDSEDLHVSVNGINCTGEETSLSDCKATQKDQDKCDIGRNAVGLRCYDNLASHCQPGEILYNQHCYKLHGKENPDDPWIKVEEASQQCKKFGGKLVDITSQNENDFLSEWLIKKYPDVTAVATGGIGMLVLGRPIWVWEGASDPMVYERWWSAWSGNQNVPKSSINGPLCIVLRKTISCTDGDEEQTTAEPRNDEENCLSDYFFWDVEDCENIRTSVFICERPMDDIGCVVGNGEGYVGTANTTASGQPCLPWDHPKVVEGLARRGAQERSSRLSGHNYCRNLGKPDRHPWCFVEGKGNSEYCAIPQCWDSGKE